MFGLTFKSSKVELKKYLSKFKGQAYSREYDRIEQLVFIKKDLARLLSSMPYAPTEDSKILVKKSGKLEMVPCLYMKGNENRLDIKVGKDDYLQLEWSDLPTESVLQVMDYYLELKIKSVKAWGLGKKGKIELADYALRMALFTDWNGLKEKSQSYAETAARYQRSYRVYVDRFLPPPIVKP
ncbi:MAG: hypothetical protein KAG98_00470, partial [Lentisphaeria bacterium]|nr:hypothetical protein [Lentisphaeria bacterium]